MGRGQGTASRSSGIKSTLFRSRTTQPLDGIAPFSRNKGVAYRRMQILRSLVNNSPQAADQISKIRAIGASADRITEDLKALIRQGVCEHDHLDNNGVQYFKFKPKEEWPEAHRKAYEEWMKLAYINEKSISDSLRHRIEENQSNIMSKDRHKEDQRLPNPIGFDNINPVNHNYKAEKQIINQEFDLYNLTKENLSKQSLRLRKNP